MLRGKAVNASVQCGVPGAELDLFQDQQEVQGQPPLREDRQVTAHHLALPHKTGFEFHVMGVGVWGMAFEDERI